MPAFIAHWDILHDGQAIAPGGVVEMSQDAALPLLARGAIAPVLRVLPAEEPTGTETPAKPPGAAAGKRRAAKDDG